MASIKSYKNKKGETLYRLQAYLGTDKATGKRVRVTRTGFKSEREALLEFSRLMLEHEEKGLQKKRPVRYKEIYNTWFEGYKHTVKESTLKKTTESFRLHILPELGEMFIEEITLEEAQAALNVWHDKLVNFRLVMRYASRVMKQAMRQGIIKTNPFDLVVVPKSKAIKQEEENRNFYDKEELQKFLLAVEKDEDLKWYAFFRLLAFTGIRKGEALALTWKDIDFNKEILTINKTITLGMNNQVIVQTPKTKSGKRTVSLDKLTLSKLSEWKEEQKVLLQGLGFKAKSNQLIFSSNRNEFIALPRPGQIADRVCKNNDLRKITVHGFRHSHCSLLFEAGLSIKEVQDRLGHSDIATTMNIYTHLTQKKRDEVADKFAEFVRF